MKNVILGLIAVFSLVFSYAQNINEKKGLINPVSWSFSLSASKVSVGDKVDLVFKATINPDYYIYGSGFNDLGPNPTELVFDNLQGAKLVGSLRCTTSKLKHDDVFDADIPVNIGQAIFIQTIVVTENKPLVQGVIVGQTCTLKDGSCRMFSQVFDFDITITPKRTTILNKSKSIVVDTISKTSTAIDTVTFSRGNDESILKKVDSTSVGRLNAVPINKKSDTSIWVFLLLAFGGGLLALMTPCVYPLIPMTVTFFVKASENKRKATYQALFYSLSIVFIYTVIGLIVALVFGAGSLNSLSTSWYFNLLFFVVFVVFGLSFLGWFEITLPNKFINSVDAKSDKGGYLGVFFMAFALVLVSFSCTGPIAASLLAGAANGEFIRPVLGMFAYSMAFAIPFGLFAIFPSWLGSLPKSGGWLNTVKVSLGFIELALAFKFFTQADLAYHWGLMSRELFISIHIAISLILSAYLFGLFRMKSDSEIKGLPVPRVIFATIFLVLALYMFPGIFGAPLKALAGYLPPLHTQEFKIGFNELPTKYDVLCDTPKYADVLHSTEGISSYFDLDQGIACSKKLNKPIFVDFTGHGCANCRRMEESVFSDKKINKKLAESFVFVSLYVDDKTILPENEWFTSSVDGRLKKTLGDKFADYQIVKFGVNAQPFYVILNPQTESLTQEPYFFDLNISNFDKFLEEGLLNFKKSSAL